MKTYPRFLPTTVVLVTVLLLMVGGCSRHGRKGDERVLHHTVAEGETLDRIAADYYGDPERADEIRKFNDLDDAVEGTQLLVPMSGEDIEALHRRERAREPYNEGLSQVTRGSYLDAIREFRAALEIDDRFADAYFNLGVTYQRMKAYDKALVKYQEALKLRPHNADYHYALGATHYHLSDFSRSIRSFKRALDINDTLCSAQYSLAKALEKAGRDRQARSAWERYLELDDSSEWATEARARLEELTQ